MYCCFEASAAWLRAWPAFSTRSPLLPARGAQLPVSAGRRCWTGGEANGGRSRQPHPSVPRPTPHKLEHQRACFFIVAGIKGAKSMRCSSLGPILRLVIWRGSRAWRTTPCRIGASAAVADAYGLRDNRCSGRNPRLALGFTVLLDLDFSQRWFLGQGAGSRTNN